MHEPNILKHVSPAKCVTTITYFISGKKLSAYLVNALITCTCICAGYAYAKPVY